MLKAVLSAVVVLVMLSVTVLLAVKGQPLDLGWAGVLSLVFGAALGVSDAAKIRARGVAELLKGAGASVAEHEGGRRE